MGLNCEKPKPEAAGSSSRRGGGDAHLKSEGLSGEKRTSSVACAVSWLERGDGNGAERRDAEADAVEAVESALDGWAAPEGCGPCDVPSATDTGAEPERCCECDGEEEALVTVTAPTGVRKRRRGERSVLTRTAWATWL